MGENETEPLAKTRTRRSNAGARMHEMMFAAEDDELLAQAYGGLLKTEDDSSDDEEYVPKDLEVDEGEKGSLGGEDDDEGSISSDGSSGDSEDDEDEEEEEEDNADEEIIGAEPDILNFDDARIVDGIRCSSKLGIGTRKQTVVSQKINPQITPGSPTKAAYDSCKKICTVCLGEQSDEDDEIVVCDSCGVSVHESCYGVSGDDINRDCISIHSDISSESTEPWFCEPCKRSVKNPFCELCPNTGGIFKQTDTGRWIHMVCALYTRGVTFENIDQLSGVSLFELNYALYGSKACTICEDRRLARSGICIGCDAGLCKTFFHATCAQREGLLFESHADEVDPYFAQCKQHADKTVVKKKKRTCIALHARLRRIKSFEECADGNLLKSNQEPVPNTSKWTPNNRPPIPFKVSRKLMTSPSLIMRLTKKSELMGLDPKSAFMTVQDEIEMARQKWHIAPAFSLEYVAYCRDRTSRMTAMKKHNAELVNQNLVLKTEEANLRERFNSIKDVVSKLKLETENMIKEARALQKSVAVTTGKQYNLPLQIEQLIARCSNAKGKNFIQESTDVSKTTNKTSSTYGCGKCGTVKDQHLLALCDTCHSYIHIYCLDPPLTRVPKKTKFGGWQCSDCSERDEEEQEEALEEQSVLAVQEADLPRRLRERIKYPDKYCHESMMLAGFWSTHKRKSKKSSKEGKRLKVEPKDVQS